MLTRCLQSDDDRIAMMAAQAILDRGYGKPVQSIDANINEGDLERFYAEVPKLAATTEEWIAGNPVAAERYLKTTCSSLPAQEHIQRDPWRARGTATNPFRRSSNAY